MSVCARREFSQSVADKRSEEDNRQSVIVRIKRNRKLVVVWFLDALRILDPRHVGLLFEAQACGSDDVRVLPVVAGA